MGLIQQSIDYNDAASQAARYAREAKKQISSECGVPHADTKCARKVNEAARQYQRDEYNLYSQKTLATWTAVMGAMAVFGVAMTPVGIYLVWTTFQETRRNAHEARRSADAFIAAERGWLTIEFRERPRPDDTAPITLRAHVKLHGRSGVEVTEFRWIALQKAAFPGFHAPYETKELSRRIETKEEDLAIQIAGFSVPIGTKFIGGWLSYQTKFPGESRTYFIGKVVEKGHTIVDDAPILTFGLKLRRDRSWPENT